MLPRTRLKFRSICSSNGNSPSSDGMVPLMRPSSNRRNFKAVTAANSEGRAPDSWFFSAQMCAPVRIMQTFSNAKCVDRVSYAPMSIPSVSFLELQVKPAHEHSDTPINQGVPGQLASATATAAGSAKSVGAEHLAQSLPSRE